MVDSNKRDEAWNYIGLDPQDINTRLSIDTPEFRSNPKLIECVEALGERANGTSWGRACLRIISIPDDVELRHIVENKDIEYIRSGEDINLVKSRVDGEYQLQLDGYTLITRRYWQCDEESSY